MVLGGKMRTLMAATVLVLISNTTQAKAQLGSLVLYLPDYAMEERISVDDLVDYVAQISELVNKHFLEIDQHTSQELKVISVMKERHLLQTSKRTHCCHSRLHVETVVQQTLC